MSDKGARPLRQRLRLFLAPTLVLALFFLIVWLFGGILVPFILALIIVFLIEPVVKRLHRVRVWRFHLPRRTEYGRWLKLKTVGSIAPTTQGRLGLS